MDSVVRFEGSSFCKKGDCCCLSVESEGRLSGRFEISSCLIRSWMLLSSSSESSPIERICTVIAIHSMRLVILPDLVFDS